MNKYYTPIILLHLLILNSCSSDIDCNNKLQLKFDSYSIHNFEDVKYPFEPPYIELIFEYKNCTGKDQILDTSENIEVISEKSDTLYLVDVMHSNKYVIPNGGQGKLSIYRQYNVSSKNIDSLTNILNKGTFYYGGNAPK